MVTVAKPKANQSIFLSLAPIAVEVLIVFTTDEERA